MTDLDTALNFHRNGQLEKAEQAYSELLKQTPDDANLLNLLGVLKMQMGKLNEAEDFLLKAVKIKLSPAFLDNLGLVYYLKKDYFNAIKYFEASVQKEPYKETIEKLAESYKYIGNSQAALGYLKILYENDKQNLDLIREIVVLADTTGDYDTSVEFYKKSLKLDKNDFIAENNLGLIYEKLSDVQQAKNCYLLSLKIKNNFEANKNLGVLYRKEKEYKKSEEYLKKALIMNPEDVQTHLSLGMTYLVQKNFYEGYEHYILKNPEIKKQYKNGWDGKNYSDSHILLFCDGGFGDYIMFVRYIYKLKAVFSKITLLVPPELERLFRHNFSFADIEINNNCICYDCSASVMDLPYLLGIDFDNIPCSEGYMNVIAESKSDLFNTDRLKVGLFWHGNQRVHKNRSIPFDKIRAFFDKDIQFYSFQKDEEKKHEHKNLINLAPCLSDFYDTACAMKNLDIMITIDSACVHLAGALGVKTFLMLPSVSEWRWFEDCKKTLWYDSVEIFRQGEKGNWNDVIDRISKKF